MTIAREIRSQRRATLLKFHGPTTAPVSSLLVTRKMI